MGWSKIVFIRSILVLVEMTAAKFCKAPSSGAYSLEHYVYDEDVPSVPEQTLTVFGLTKSDTVQQAITQFQKANPDVQVEFSSLGKAGNEVTTEDIRTLEDFYRSKWKKIQELLRAKSRLPEERQKLFAKALRLLWSEGNKAVKKKVRQAVAGKREGAKFHF